LEKDEAYAGHNNTKGLMNLLTITIEDKKIIEGKVNDACINVLSDVLNKQVEKDRISICHTQFFVELNDRGWQEGSRYIQNDPSSPIIERWKANKHAQAHITSDVLLIPCHFPGHWALAIRVKVPTGKHSLYVLDSLGRDATERTFLKVRESLKNIPIIRNKIKLKTHTIRTQRSDEC
jgi:Ulp1 family protease